MASAGAVITVVMILAALGIGSLIHTEISGEVKDNLQQQNNTEALTTYENIENQGWGALRMLGMAAFVIGAVTILAVLKGIS